MNKEHGKPPSANQAKKEENITVSIPYVKGVSETIKRLLGPLSVKTVMRTQQRKWRLMRGAKDTQPANTVAGGVYDASSELLSVSNVSLTAQSQTF